MDDLKFKSGDRIIKIYDDNKDFVVGEIVNLSGNNAWVKVFRTNRNWIKHHLNSYSTSSPVNLTLNRNTEYKSDKGMSRLITDEELLVYMI